MSRKKATSSTETSLDIDQQVSKVQFVQPIDAPILKSFSRLALTQFNVAYSKYLQSVKAHGIEGQSKLECTDPSLMAVLEHQYLRKPKEDITAEDLEIFIEKRLDTEVHYTEEGIVKLFSDLKMDLSEPDPVQRVTAYNVDFLKKKDEHGLAQLMDSVHFRKQLVELLLNGIRPSALRQLMRQKTKTSNARSDPTTFFDLLEQWAPLQDAFHSEVKKTENYLKARESGKPKGKQGTKRKSFPDKRGREEAQSSNGQGRKKFKMVCLICKKDNHRTTEHRGASKEEITKAFDTYKKEKAEVGRNLSISKHVDNLDFLAKSQEDVSKRTDLEDNLGNKRLHLKNLSSSFNSRPLPEVTINGSLTIPCLLDSGTDRPVVSGDIVRRISGESYPLHTVYEAELPVTPTQTQQVRCTKGIKLNLKLRLPNSSGPLQFPQVECVIVDLPMPVEVLLGDSFLKELGIDINQLVFEAALKQKQSSQSVSIDELTSSPEPQPQSNNSETHDFQLPDDTLTAVEDMINRAVRKGLPTEYIHKLRATVTKYDIWRTRLGPDGPAKVPPMQIRLKEGAPSIKAPNRRYPPLYRQFMKKRLTELEQYGLIYKNNGSRFSSAVHVVPKVETPKDIETDFRWTIDLRRINDWTETITWPMPNMDVITESVSEAKAFARVDFLKGYWQMPLHEDSQEMCSMVTDLAVYTPTRVPQGSSDAVMYFQSSMQKCFEKQLYKSLLIWLDDILVYSKSIEDILTALDELFSVCAEYNLKLSPAKCELYQTKVKFCGKIISGAGTHQDPDRIKALLNMPPPKNAADLQQYLCALNWMRHYIPDFARHSKPLRKVLERHAAGTNRKTRTLKAIQLELDSESMQNFNRLNQAVAEAVTLAHPKSHAEFFLFTDASQEGWGSVLFQIEHYDPSKEISSQKCEPLYFLSGSFSGASHRWSIPEKEAFAIVESVERLDFILIRPKAFFIMTDHRNLEFIFASNTHLKAATRHKISRWALALTCFRYEIKHIDGEKNVWADLLSRWGNSPAQVLSIKNLSLHPFEEGSDFVFPDIVEIYGSQDEHRNVYPDRTDLSIKEENGRRVIYHRGKVWIPECDDELWYRILVVAHCGSAGHRGVSSTTKAVQKFCSAQGLRTRVLKFAKDCLLCLQTKGGTTIPRPLGRTIQAQGPNEVLHFDYYHVGKAFNGWHSVLVLKDGLTHFVELQGCSSMAADVAAEALLDWFKRYGIVPTWVSDQPTHYRNIVLNTLAQRLTSLHHFTTAYCPWANGTVERANRDLSSIFKCILGEFKMPLDQWPLVLPVVQFVLNNTQQESLSGLAPIQVFMGREPSSPLKEVFNPVTETFSTIPPPTEKIKESYLELRAKLAMMHKEVQTASREQHKRNAKRFNNAKQANFHIGDFVLWSRIDNKKTLEKLQFVWRGPFRVIDTTSDHVFTIEDLHTKKSYIVHSSRLKFYHDASLNMTAEIMDHVSRQGLIYTVRELKDISWNKSHKRWEVLVAWDGFEDSESTWESFESLLKDIPKIVKNFIEDLENSRVKKQIIRKYRKVFQA